MRLHRADLSDEQNFALYGRCANPAGHGHNFDVEIAVAGDVDPQTGMVANFYDLDQLLREEIYNRVDHMNLNTDVDFLRGVIPTTENLALKFWQRLEPRLKDVRLYCVTVGERGTNSVSYYGPSATLNTITSPAAGANSAAGHPEEKA